MKLLADQNIPATVCKALAEEGFDVLSINDVSPGATDREVVTLAEKEQRIILTFDKDFGGLINFRGVHMLTSMIIHNFSIPRNIFINLPCQIEFISGYFGCLMSHSFA